MDIEIHSCWYFPIGYEIIITINQLHIYPIRYLYQSKNQHSFCNIYFSKFALLLYILMIHIQQKHSK